VSGEWISAVVAGAFGFGFGFVGSVPIAGPVSALVFRSGVAGRTRRGQGIAIGSAVGEAIYAFLAFWGVGAVFDRWPMLGPLSRVLAGLILVTLGVVFIRRPAPKRATSPDDPVAAKGGRSAFFIGLGVTGLNPTLIATWTAVTATTFSSGLATYSLAGALLFAGGVFAGISLWFLLLLAALDRFRDKVTPRTLDRVVQAMGVFLLLVGAWFLVSGLRHFVGSA
jgi:threonine/homoserine/homoserine lactone efflux protein